MLKLNPYNHTAVIIHHHYHQYDGATCAVFKSGTSYKNVAQVIKVVNADRCLVIDRSIVQTATVISCNSALGVERESIAPTVAAVNSDSRLERIIRAIQIAAIVNSGD